MSSKKQLLIDAIKKGHEAVDDLRIALYAIESNLDTKDPDLNDQEVDLTLSADGDIENCKKVLDEVQAKLNDLL